jgi:O-antigen ligase
MLSPLNNIYRSLTLLAVFAFPVNFLAIKHGVHVSLYGLLIISIIYWLSQSTQKFFYIKDLNVLAVVISLSSIFIATALTQLIRQDIYWPSFDGPSRLALAAIVFIFLRTQSISFLKLLEVAIPIGLMLTLIMIVSFPETSVPWGNRFATKFVDPNTLGSQSVILGIICLLMINKNNPFSKNVFLLIGSATGIYLSIHAGSRGGWLALPFILIAWSIIQFKERFTCNLNNLFKLILIIFLGTTALTLTFIALAKLPMIAARIGAGYADIMNLLNGDFNTSIGTRIAMWIISFKYLVPIAGLSGLGETDVKNLLITLPIDPIQFREAIYHLSNTGPHSDFLAKLLSMGYIGCFAYVLTVITPLMIFIKNSFNANLQQRSASRIGLYYLIGIIICGLSNEMLSLKYLCSFYGLMIACLAAEVLRDNSNTKEFNEKVV